MTGLNSGTHSKIAVIGGVLTIAIADAFSDALGIHVSEESENNHTEKEIWISTISTFLSKFVFALTFLVPLLLLELNTAVIASVIYGFSMLGLFSFIMGRKQGVNPFKVTCEHLLIAAIVVFLTHFTGAAISKFLNC